MVFYFKKANNLCFLPFFLGNIRKVSFFALGSKLKNFFSITCLSISNGLSGLWAPMLWDGLSHIALTLSNELPRCREVHCSQSIHHQV